MSVSRSLGAPIFGLLAIVQAFRFVQQWPVTINGFSVPVWASAIAALVFALLSYLHWREGAPRKP